MSHCPGTRRWAAGCAMCTTLQSRTRSFQATTACQCCRLGAHLQPTSFATGSLHSTRHTKAGSRLPSSTPVCTRVVDTTGTGSTPTEIWSGLVDSTWSYSATTSSAGTRQPLNKVWALAASKQDVGSLCWLHSALPIVHKQLSDKVVTHLGLAKAVGFAYSHLLSDPG